MEGTCSDINVSCRYWSHSIGSLTLYDIADWLDQNVIKVLLFPLVRYNTKALPQTTSTETTLATGLQHTLDCFSSLQIKRHHQNVRDQVAVHGSQLRNSAFLPCSLRHRPQSLHLWWGAHPATTTGWQDYCCRYEHEHEWYVKQQICTYAP